MQFFKPVDYVLRRSRMYKANARTETQTIPQMNADASRACDTLLAPQFDDSHEIEAQEAADIPAHLLSLPRWNDFAAPDLIDSLDVDAQEAGDISAHVSSPSTWNDLANIDFSHSVHVSRRDPRLQADVLKDLVSKIRPMITSVAESMDTDADAAARNYVGLRALSAYEAALFPRFHIDFEWSLEAARHIRTRDASKAAKKSKRKWGAYLWRCHIDTSSDISCPTFQPVELLDKAFYEGLLRRYKTGLEAGFSVLSLDHDVTLSLIARSRLAEYIGGEGWTDDLQNALRQHVDSALSKALLGDRQRNFYAEWIYYQLVLFSRSVPDEDKRISRFPTERLDSGHGLAVEQALDAYTLDSAIRTQLEGSLYRRYGWPAVNASVVEDILVNVRQAIDALAEGFPEAAFRTFAFARQEIHEAVLEAYHQAFIEEVMDKKTETEESVDKQYAADKIKLTNENCASKAKRRNEKVACERQEILTNFLDGLAFHYCNGLRAMYSTLSFGSDSDLANDACKICELLADEEGYNYQYRPERYVRSNSVVSDSDGIDQAEARERKQLAVAWALTDIFGSVAGSVVSSGDPYKHYVEDAIKEARYAEKENARALVSQKARVGMAVAHSLVPVAASLIREATKVTPRHTSATIFDYTYWKNATDVRAHHTQTETYQHRYTDEEISRRRVDERVLTAGAWTPSERIEGFNRLPPGVNPRNVCFTGGQSDVDIHTRFRNGLSRHQNISSRAILPPDPPFGVGPDGRFPTLQLREPSGGNTQPTHGNSSSRAILPPESSFQPGPDGRFPTLRLHKPSRR